MSTAIGKIGDLYTMSRITSTESGWAGDVVAEVLWEFVGYDLFEFADAFFDV